MIPRFLSLIGLMRGHNLGAPPSDRATHEPSRSVSALRVGIAGAAALCLAFPSIAEARCWGANGYCTRDRREAENVRRLAAERDALNGKHNHATWQERIDAHSRISWLVAKLENECRFASRTRKIAACRAAGMRGY